MHLQISNPAHITVNLIHLTSWAVFKPPSPIKGHCPNPSIGTTKAHSKSKSNPVAPTPHLWIDSPRLSIPRPLTCCGEQKLTVKNVSTVCTHSYHSCRANANWSHVVWMSAHIHLPSPSDTNSVFFQIWVIHPGP